MNKWAIGSDKEVPRLENNACFSGCYAKSDKSFCYYEIAKMLPDEQNEEYLNLARQLFDFEVLPSEDDVILIKLKLVENRISNLAKLTFLRYLDKNECGCTQIKTITEKAFEIRDEVGDLFHALIVAHNLTNISGSGHFITPVAADRHWISCKLRGPINIKEVKKNIVSGKNSVHEVFSRCIDARIKDDNESVKEYYTHLLEEVKKVKALEVKNKKKLLTV